MAEIKLSREQRRGAIAAIQRYFEEERGESVGELAAMLFLDFLVEEIGEIFYNKGVDDAQVLLRQWSALDDELEVIKMPVRRPSTVNEDDDEDDADEG